MGADFPTYLGQALFDAPLDLLFPLVLACCMAWNDMRTRRVPNYLTFGSAAAGLIYQGWARPFPRT